MQRSPHHITTATRDYDVLLVPPQRDPGGRVEHMDARRIRLHPNQRSDRWPNSRRASDRERNVTNSQMQQLLVPEYLGEFDRRVKALRVWRRSSPG